MFNKVVPITKEKHLNSKVKPIDGFDFAKETHLASIMVHEFSRAASIYPIVFLEDKDQFKPVVMSGLEEGKNLFVDGDVWNASYIPAIIRRYPFALAGTGEENKYTICVDEESKFLNEEDGEPLFDEKGEASEAMERVKKYLTELQQMERFTTEFCKYFEEKNMFTPLNMKVRIGNEIKNVSGAYVINEERLNSLSNESFIEMREKQYLSVVYSHLSSLSQIERLLAFQDKDAGVTKQIEDRFEDKK